MGDFVAPGDGTDVVEGEAVARKGARVVIGEDEGTSPFFSLLMQLLTNAICSALQSVSPLIGEIHLEPQSSQGLLHELFPTLHRDNTDKGGQTKAGVEGPAVFKEGEFELRSDVGAPLVGTNVVGAPPTGESVPSFSSC